MRRRVLPWLVALCLASAVVASLLLFGTSRGDREDELRVAVAEESLRPPGTTLAPGAEVQAGSQLVRTSLPVIDTYPAPGTTPEPIGWQAVLVIDGDPVDVWDRYVEHLDLPDTARAEQSCVVSMISAPTARGDFATPPRRFITEPPLDGENRLECTATVGRALMAMAVGAARCPEVGCELHSAAHLYLSVLEPPRDYGGEQFGTDELRHQRAVDAAVDPTADLDPWQVPVPTGQVFTPELGGDYRSRLPEAGERVDDGLDYYLNGTGSRFVPAGGRSLVAPAMLIECNSGLVSLLEIDGAPSDVVAAYDEADDADDDLPLVQGRDAEDRAWAFGEIISAGGEYLDLIALQESDDTSILLLTECGD